MLHSPPFWYRQKTTKDIFLKTILTPLSWIYGWLARKRFELYFPVPMEKPIICVGNLVTGGAGKTPAVLALVDLLKDSGFNPHLLTRGYGGLEPGPIQVNPDTDSSHDVGDEAMLLVKKAPTWVSTNRPLGAQAAMDSGANIVVMDDGFQNPVIYKDFSFVIIDGAVGFGNKKLLPAGPLREPIDSGLSRANAVLIVGEDKLRVADRIAAMSDIPILFASTSIDKDNIDIKEKKLVAFAGLARPEKFKYTLECGGADIVEWQAFPDHHPYSEADIEDLIKIAEHKEAELITTRKDYVRIPEKFKDKIHQLSITMVWQDKTAIMPLIEEALEKRQK